MWQPPLGVPCRKARTALSEWHVEAAADRSGVQPAHVDVQKHQGFSDQGTEYALCDSQSIWAYHFERGPIWISSDAVLPA